MLTTPTKEERYLDAVERLRRLALMMGGRKNLVLEWNAYWLLQIHHSPLRALYRHAKYVVWSWSTAGKASLRMRATWFWYRNVRRWSEERTLEYYEARIDAEMGGSYGDEWEGVEEAIVGARDKMERR